MDNTITEQDLEHTGRQFVQGLRDAEAEPDLAVDGLSDSLISRLLGLFGIVKA